MTPVMSTKENRALDLFRLDHKTVVVTGATGGIGHAAALALAEAGADIVSIQVPNDPGAQALRGNVEQLGRKFLEFETNLKDYKSIPLVFAEIWRAGVIPDILLNSAGISRHAKVEDTSIEYLDDVCHS